MARDLRKQQAQSERAARLAKAHASKAAARATTARARLNANLTRSLNQEVAHAIRQTEAEWQVERAAAQAELVHRVRETCTDVTPPITPHTPYPLHAPSTLDLSPRTGSPRSGKGTRIRARPIRPDSPASAASQAAPMALAASPPAAAARAVRTARRLSYREDGGDEEYEGEAWWAVRRAHLDGAPHRDLPRKAGKPGKLPGKSAAQEVVRASQQRPRARGGAGGGGGGERPEWNAAPHREVPYAVRGSRSLTAEPWAMEGRNLAIGLQVA